MMNLQKVARNSVFILIGDSLSYLLLLILTIYLVRYLGSVEFGKYSFVLAYVTIIPILSDFGLSNLSIRELARDRSKAQEYFANIVIIKLILSLISIMIILSILYIFKYSYNIIILTWIVGLTTILVSFVSFFRSIFRAFEMMKFEMITKIIERIVVSLSVLPAIILESSLTYIVLLMLFGQSIVLFITLTYLSKYFFKLHVNLDLNLAKVLIKKSYPFLMASIFSVIYFHSDTIMLSIMKGDAEVGWYNAAYRLTMGILFVPNAIMGSLFPALSNLYVSNENKITNIYEKTFKILLAFALPLAIGTTLLADKIIISLYGMDYYPSIGVLQILIWVTLLLVVYPIIGCTLASINKQIIDSKITGMAAIINVALNGILIPSYSYIGAGFASFISQIFVLSLEYNYLRAHGYEINLAKIIFKAFQCGLIMSISIIFIRYILDSWIVIFAISFLVYILSLYVTKSIDEDEIKIAKSLILSIRNKECIKNGDIPNESQ